MLTAVNLVPLGAVADLLPDDVSVAVAKESTHGFGIFATLAVAHETGPIKNCDLSAFSGVVTVWYLYVANQFVGQTCTFNAFLENGYWHQTPQAVEKTIEHYTDDFVLRLDCHIVGDPNQGATLWQATGHLTTQTGLFLPLTGCNWMVPGERLPPAASWNHPCQVGGWFRAELFPVTLEGFVLTPMDAASCVATVY